MISGVVEISFDDQVICSLNPENMGHKCTPRRAGFEVPVGWMSPYRWTLNSSLLAMERITLDMCIPDLAPRAYLWSHASSMH